MPDSHVNAERRRAARRAAAHDEPVARVRLRAGSHLVVVDVSNAGVLVEGTTRLLPGTHVDVHIIGAEGRLLVRSRVVRAFVSRVEAERIHYRGALAFERAVETRPGGYPVPAILASPVDPQGTVYPDDASPVESATRDSARTGSL